MKLFNRTARVTVLTKQFHTRIVFQVDKNLENSSNKATMALYNLSSDSRGLLEKSAPAHQGNIGELARLEAGYDNQLALIFLGNITKVSHSRSGPDIVTTVECGDGEVAIRNARLNLSFKAGVTRAAVAKAAIDALKALGVTEGKIEAFTPRVYKAGFSYYGGAAGLLNQLCETQGYEWSIQDSSLQIIKQRGSTGQDAVLLTKDTGMIGLPTKVPKGFQAKSLLNPEIRPGRKIRLKSQQLTLDAEFVARKVIHQGDTRESDFTTSIEGNRDGF